MTRKRLNLDHFAGRADEAAFWEAWVGAVLARCGLYTLHHPFTLAQHPGDLASYAQTWDLDVGSTYDKWFCRIEASRKVEVKSVNIRFTGPKDYPYEQCLVCSEASFLRKWPKSDVTGSDFLIVSRETGAMVWIPAGTKIELGVETYDTDRGEQYRSVRTHKENLRDLKAFVKTFG